MTIVNEYHKKKVEVSGSEVDEDNVVKVTKSTFLPAHGSICNKENCPCTYEFFYGSAKLKQLGAENFHIYFQVVE